MSGLDYLLFPHVFYPVILIFSLCVGSLLNVIIFRLPKILEHLWNQQCCELLNQPPPQKEAFNLFLPPSHCPHCKQTIKAWQNIPILSYLLLRGHCHYCKHPISLRYPLVEILTVALSGLVVWHFGIGLTTIAALLYTWCLQALLFIDLDTQLLPDSLTLGLLWLGLLVNTQSVFIPLENAVFSAAIAYLLLWSFMKIFYWVTGKVGMGHGDFKLFAALGAWLGWQQLPFILVISSLSGALIGGAFLIFTRQHKDTPIPFGPFLCIAGFIGLLWGEPLLNWYISHL